MAEDEQVEVTDEQIKAVFNALRRSYSRLDYPHFCEAFNFNIKYDIQPFTFFGEGIRNLFQLSDSRLTRIVRWGLEHKHDEI